MRIVGMRLEALRRALAVKDSLLYKIVLFRQVALHMFCFRTDQRISAMNITDRGEQKRALRTAKVHHIPLCWYTNS